MICLVVILRPKAPSSFFSSMASSQLTRQSNPRNEEREIDGVLSLCAKSVYVLVLLGLGQPGLPDFYVEPALALQY